MQEGKTGAEEDLLKVKELLENTIKLKRRLGLEMI